MLKIPVLVINRAGNLPELSVKISSSFTLANVGAKLTGGWLWLYFQHINMKVVSIVSSNSSENLSNVILKISSYASNICLLPAVPNSCVRSCLQTIGRYLDFAQDHAVLTASGHAIAKLTWWLCPSIAFDSNLSTSL